MLGQERGTLYNSLQRKIPSRACFTVQQRLVGWNGKCMLYKHKKTSHFRLGAVFCSSQGLSPAHVTLAAGSSHLHTCIMSKASESLLHMSDQPQTPKIEPTPCKLARTHTHTHTAKSQLYGQTDGLSKPSGSTHHCLTWNFGWDNPEEKCQLKSWQMAWMNIY